MVYIRASKRNKGELMEMKFCQSWSAHEVGFPLQLSPTLTAIFFVF